MLPIKSKIAVLNQNVEKRTNKKSFGSQEANFVSIVKNAFLRAKLTDFEENREKLTCEKKLLQPEEQTFLNMFFRCG
jgi:hypothetical protein